MSRSGEPKRLYVEKLSRLPGLPTYRGETTRPPELSRPPRRVRDPNVNGWLNFRKKQAKCYLGQGSSGGGLSRVPETM